VAGSQEEESGRHVCNLAVFAVESPALGDLRRQSPRRTSTAEKQRYAEVCRREQLLIIFERNEDKVFLVVAFLCVELWVNRRSLRWMFSESSA
jgi:hypothetical protein